MNAKELKPCPFCGSEAVIKEYGVGNRKNTTFTDYKMGCEKCEIWFRGRTEVGIADGKPYMIEDGYTKAIEKWNKRVNENETN